jgi:hypothetical protein
MLYDPETGRKGMAKTSGKKIFLELDPGKSCFIEINGDPVANRWRYFREAFSYTISGEWKTSFISGAPSIPATYSSAGISSWVNAPDTMAKYFSGTGRYETKFDLPEEMKNSAAYKLNLGDVREVADIWINDHFIGRAWSVPFEVNIKPSDLLPKGNKLRIEVRNLDANRIIWMDRNKIKWQNFFFVDVTYNNFNASGWNPVPSGIVGPVQLKSSGNQNE